MVALPTLVLMHYPLTTKHKVPCEISQFQGELIGLAGIGGAVHENPYLHFVNVFRRR